MRDVYLYYPVYTSWWKCVAISIHNSVTKTKPANYVYNVLTQTTLPVVKLQKSTSYRTPIVITPKFFVVEMGTISIAKNRKVALLHKSHQYFLVAYREVILLCRYIYLIHSDTNTSCNDKSKQLFEQHGCLRTDILTTSRPIIKKIRICIQN